MQGLPQGCPVLFVAVSEPACLLMSLLCLHGLLTRLVARIPLIAVLQAGGDHSIAVVDRNSSVDSLQGLAAVGE